MNNERQKSRRGRPATGKAMPGSERMRRLRARRKAAGLKPVTSWVSTNPPAWSTHRLHDARSLAMHTVIAQRIGQDPALLDVARMNLQRWSSQRGGNLPPALGEWQAILARPWKEVAALITEQSERAVRLRQSTPFAGILKPVERRRIHDALRT